MLYVLIGLVLIFSGIVFYGLWLFRWRGTRIGDIPVLLDALMKIFAPAPDFGGARRNKMGQIHAL